MLIWKSEDQIEVFSNLKVLTEKYPQFNYNTLNNYLSKDKIAYDNDSVRIERMNVINKKSIDNTSSSRKIIPVIKKQIMKTYDEKQEDLEYWLKQTPAARVAAVTALIQGSKKKRAAIR
jgi:hypothetical protein